MRILQICHRVPYPPIDGGNIVMMNMALALVENGHEVHQFSLNTIKHYTDIETIPNQLRKKISFHASKINTKITVSGFVKSIFGQDSYNITRFFDESAEQEIVKILASAEFDIVQLETLFAAPYIECIRKNTKAKIVLRAHNVEHIIWERLAAVEKNAAKKLILKFLASRLKKFELVTLNKIDALIPITIVDEQMFRDFNFTKPVCTLPMCIDISEYKLDSSNSEMCLFHLGSMDWMPNLEAVEWFLSECWPLIHIEHPALKLYLAGRSFPQNIIDANHPFVICEGRIEDAHAYMMAKQIMIVPLHSGSGMRVKIIQGMAHGKTIISTTIGAEGIPAIHEKNILIANTPAEFALTISKCLENPSWCKTIGTNARKFAEENYGNEAVANRATRLYKEITNYELRITNGFRISQ